MCSLNLHYAICWFVAALISSYPECAVGAFVSGPGLAPDRIVMPARYFYINLTSEEPLGYSPEKEQRLRVEVGGRAARGAGSCRLWTSKLDRRDGTYIVRYKLYETCTRFYIKVFYDDEHIGGSPFAFEGLIQPDHCNCPENNLEEWLEQYGCPKSYFQISEDLEPFPSVDMRALTPKILEEFNRPQSISICHYIIKDNQINRKCYGDHVGFNMFSDNILLFLARKTRLPDTELFMNLGDWPLVKRARGAALPVWSWCGSEDTLDIVLPTYDITESTVENMGRVMLDMLSVQGNTEVPWEHRAEQAFWRGRDSSAERLALVDIARAHPDLFNASLTNFFFFRDQEAKYGPKQPHVSFFKFFDYKYQISVDGTVAAYRLPYLLAGGSLVLKQESPFYEHFYHQLRPFEHYVPVKRDLSDLAARVRWARAHDADARRIAEAGRRLAQAQLAPHDVVCYHAVLISEWSKRLRGEVVLPDDMSAVPQPSDEGKCVCAAGERGEGEGSGVRGEDRGERDEL